MFSRDKVKYKLTSADMFKKCKDKIRQQAKKENISIKEATFTTTQESIYSIEEVEQLLENMHFSDSESELEWLIQYIKEVTIDEVNVDNVKLYSIKVNKLEVEALHDTGASLSVMVRHFFERLPNKPKLIKCTRNISGVGGEALVPAGECFVQLQIGKKTFRYRVIIIENLKCNYILGQVLHRTNRFSTGYFTTGSHYITINGEMIAQAIS